MPKRLDYSKLPNVDGFLSHVRRTKSVPEIVATAIEFQKAWNEARGKVQPEFYDNGDPNPHAGEPYTLIGAYEIANTKRTIYDLLMERFPKTVPNKNVAKALVLRGLESGKYVFGKGGRIYLKADMEGIEDVNKPKKYSGPLFDENDDEPEL